MAERSMISQGVQLGVESTLGTAVAANKKLLGVSIEPSIKVDIKNFRPSGGKFSTITALGKEWSEAKISGPLTYTDFTYLMASNVAYAAPAQQGGTSAYLWTATPGQTGEDTVKGYTIEQGSGVRAHKSTYNLVNSLGYTITRNEATIKGATLGKPITDGITLTATPTNIPLVPVLPTQVSIYADAASGDLGTTKLTRVFNIDWEQSNRFAGVWPIDAAVSGFAAHVEVEPDPMFKIKVMADSAGMTYLAGARLGTRVFFRVEGIGAEVDTGYDYTFRHDVSAECTGVGDFEDIEGVYGLEFSFRAIYDSTWGKAFQFQLINGLTGL